MITIAKVLATMMRTLTSVESSYLALWVAKKADATLSRKSFTSLMRRPWSAQAAVDHRVRVVVKNSSVALVKFVIEIFLFLGPILPASDELRMNRAQWLPSLDV